MNKPKKSRADGFTLIELMIVIAIIGILVAIAAPEYKKFSNRANFTEVILATTEFKAPAEVAVQLGVVTTEADLNAGQHGIPDKLDIASVNRKPVGKWVQSVDLSQGVLTAESVLKDENNAGYKYVLNATITGESITWTFDRGTSVSTCISAGIC